jgi:hypothetical protein
VTSAGSLGVPPQPRLRLHRPAFKKHRRCRLRLSRRRRPRTRLRRQEPSPGHQPRLLGGRRPLPSCRGPCGRTDRRPQAALGPGRRRASARRSGSPSESRPSDRKHAPRRHLRAECDAVHAVAPDAAARIRSLDCVYGSTRCIAPRARPGSSTVVMHLWEPRAQS